MKKRSGMRTGKNKRVGGESVVRREKLKMRLQIEIRVELGGALKMNERCSIKSDLAFFMMRSLITGAGGHAEAQTGS